MTAPDVVVLRAGTEGLSMAAYAEALKARLPEYSVHHARVPAAERAAAEDARVLTGIEPPKGTSDHDSAVELFACTFAGVDHLPLEALTEQGVIVTNAAGIHAPGIAEQAIGAMTGFARGLHTGWKHKRHRTWQHFHADELTGRTVTIIGLGSIGTAIAERLAGLDVHTIGVRYTPAKGGPTDRVIGYDSARFTQALAETDYLVLACPLTATTERLVDAAALETLPPTAVVINVARGGVIDTAALVDALKTESIRGAALDVTDPEPLPPEHPLWTLGNCVITPHMGGHTPQHWSRLAAIVAHNTRALDAGDLDSLRNVVARP